MHAAILGCPLGEVGATNDGVPSLLPEGGEIAETCGIGGSATSDSSSSGYGASAGGMYGLVMTCIKLPGSTGLMYAGMSFSLYFKHRFSALPNNH